MEWLPVPKGITDNNWPPLVGPKSLRRAHLILRSRVNCQCKYGVRVPEINIDLNHIELLYASYPKSKTLPVPSILYFYILSVNIYNPKFNIFVLRSLLKYDSNGICINAFEIASSPLMLRLAYESIKSKPGNMTKGSIPETLDGISLVWFKETSDALRSCLYSFKPSRRSYIPKANGNLRPLGISPPREKIIQQSLRMVMEAVLEPKFLPTSHGFRPKRGCHSALRTIRKWQGVPWLLEGDIKAYFDSIDHHLLCELIGKHFRDPQLTRLYWLMVKAGYVEFCTKNKDPNKTAKITTVGVPQGGIISPLWSNLVLHELDQFMAERQMQINEKMKQIKPSLNNPEYCKISRLINKLTKIRELLGPKGWIKQRDLRKDLKSLLSLRRFSKSTFPNPDYRRLEYVRYADDWLVGVWAPKSYVVSLRDEIRTFLAKLNLELSMEKTLITNTRLCKAKFLGTYIMRPFAKLNKVVRDLRGNLKKISGGALIMNAPIKKIVDKLREKHLLARYHPEGFTTIYHHKPAYIQSWINVPVKDLIILYRSILAGILNYWSFVDNRASLLKIYGILKRSLSLLSRFPAVWQAKQRVGKSAPSGACWQISLQGKS